MYRPDTDTETQKVYDDLVRGLTDEERFSRGIGLIHFARQMCLAGIQDRFPGIGPGDLKVRLFEAVYGADFTDAEKSVIFRALRAN